ncbi:Protein LONGIFOLIA 2 [Ananas comosus]|uniref:Protein LONGIFOLIA 2 n=1 Tax=Ananas comosus TaxID=4615 RepID=A0A199UHG2_ANACO|nr:Protein LONGIFOLIA 2 [Ananas comosus]
MAAKHLNAFYDENPDFHKQVGFDRHHLIGGRRINKHSHERILSGYAIPNSKSQGRENNTTPSRIILEKNISKRSNEAHQFSLESSRASFSSTSSSSFSSVDQSFFSDRPAKSSFDIRDVVKDSINGDSKGLSIKTSCKEAKSDKELKYKDSPRPLLLSKSLDGTYVIAINRGVKEEPLKLSQCEAKGASFSAISRENRRFSCDGRELPRLSVDSRDNGKSNTKLRERPRLSLDSKEGTMNRSNFDSKSSSMRRDLDRNTLNRSFSIASGQESPGHRRSSSIIAKLMGLEALPSEELVVHVSKVEKEYNYFGELESPKVSYNSLVSKPKSSSSSRVSTESAPWRDKDQSAIQRATTGHRKPEMKRKDAPIYGEFEKKLKEIEFAKELSRGKFSKQVGNRHDWNFRTITVKGNITSRAFDSPIVIMKPAKLDSRKKKVPNDVFLSRDKKFNAGKEYTHSEKGRSQIKLATERSAETPSSVSPRLLRKVESERKSLPPIPSNNLKKPKRQYTDKQLPEPASPRSGQRPKSAPVKRSERRKFGHNEIKASKRSDIEQVKEVGERNLEQIDLNSAFVQQNMKSLDIRESKGDDLLSNEKNDHSILNDDLPVKDIETVAPEQPSPVSVLDAPFYQDDIRSSPLKRISNSFQVEETHTSDEYWNPTSLPDTPPSKVSKEVSNMENMAALVEKLKQLSSRDDEVVTVDQDAVFLDSKDHRYVYEILSASGLLRKDFTAEFKSSINPELFLVLEQTKIEQLTTPAKKPKPNPEKLHRKLVFDVANEIIAQKMEIGSAFHRQSSFFCMKKLTGQQLFKDVCMEIDQLQAESRNAGSFDDDDEDGLSSGENKTVGGWEKFGNELQEMVLEIEKLIFKDLVDEVICGEAARNLGLKKLKLQRQLFN